MMQVGLCLMLSENSESNPTLPMSSWHKETSLTLQSRPSLWKGGVGCHISSEKDSVGKFQAVIVGKFNRLVMVCLGQFQTKLETVNKTF